MLDSLIFSINTVFPIFIIVILGAALKRTNFLSDKFFSDSERFVFKVALPSMLFLEVSRANPSELFDAGFIGYCVLGIVLTFLIPCAIVPLFVKSNDKRGAFIQGVYRSNFAILGTTLAANMFGDDGVAQIAMVMPFAITLFNVFAVLILSIYAPEDKKLTKKQFFKNILKNVVTNPLIIAVVLALPFLLTPLELPSLFSKSLTYLSNMSMPLALMSLGANFTLESLRGRWSLALIASTLKTIVVPLCMVLPAIALGYRGVQLGTVFILFGGPAAVSSYIMAKNMDSDYELAGQILLFTTLMCVATIFAGVFTLRLCGLI